MTRYEEVVAVMESGRRYTAAELMDELDWSKGQAMNALESATAHRLVERSEIEHTPSGPRRYWIKR